jgi:hypothetical protein
MFRRVYELATDPNFRPFVIVLHSGTRYRVRTHDHIFFIRDDEGNVVETWFEVVTGARAYNVPPEAISAVELEPVKQPS